MIDELRQNLEHEKKLVSDMAEIMSLINKTPEKRDFYITSLDALLAQLKILNSSVSSLVGVISPIKSLSPENKTSSPKVVSLSYTSPVTKEKKFISVNKEDKDKFIKQLQISEDLLSRVRKTSQKIETGEIKPNYLAGVSSYFFSNFSEKLSRNFSELSDDLKKANIRFLTSTYISIAIFVSLLVLILGLLGMGVLLVISLSYIMWAWIPFVLMGISLVLFYIYPAVEKAAVQKRILQELPFATIHMAAIAGSNVEPTKIFRIIAASKEYPTVGLELRKVVNQTDLYGYDLVTALKNAAKQTSNARLVEMFNGLATNISSGGGLKEYLEKKSENLLNDYTLERQSYNDLAGTFMDIYISILITAPLVLMMMFIVMNLSGLNLGSLSINTLLILSLAGVVLVNIVFLFVVELKQPKN